MKSLLTTSTSFQGSPFTIVAVLTSPAPVLGSTSVTLFPLLFLSSLGMISPQCIPVVPLPEQLFLRQPHDSLLYFFQILSPIKLTHLFCLVSIIPYINSIRIEFPLPRITSPVPQTVHSIW